MKNFINYFTLLCIILLLSCSAKAQNRSFVGFYDGSKMELVFNLYVLPNQEFVLKIIYGSEDRLIMGTWKDDGTDSIFLQENRERTEPFVVYTGKGNATKRRLNFKYFDQNTVTGLAIGAPFEASKLKYILKPDEYSFSYEYDMDVPKDSSGTIFLSRSLSDISQEIYPFQLDDKAQEVLIMYNSLADKPIFQASATFQDGELFLFDEDQGQQRVGKKQALPDGIEKDLAEIKSYQTIPDTQQVKMDEGILEFHRIKPDKLFNVDVFINAEESYFGNDLHEEDEANEIPYTAPPPPASLKKK